MSYKLARLWAVCLFVHFSTSAGAQILTGVNSQLPARQASPRLSPLDRAALVRAEMARRGIPSVGRGHLDQSVIHRLSRTVPGQYIVKFKPGTAKSAMGTLFKSMAARVISHIPQLDI